MKVYISKECRGRSFFILSLGIAIIIGAAVFNLYISYAEILWLLWGCVAVYVSIIALLVLRDKSLMGYCVVSENVITMYCNRRHAICSVDLNKSIYYDVIMITAAPGIRKEFIVLSNSVFETQTELKHLFYVVKSAILSKTQIVMPYDDETRKICPIWLWTSVKGIRK